MSNGKGRDFKAPDSAYRGRARKRVFANPPSTIMSSESAESTCTVPVLSCSFEELQDSCGNERSLAEHVLINVIRPNCARLRAADPRCRLDNLLSAMLEHAPHPLGQRYVANCLLTAHQKGEDGVVDAAKA
jgi:hypothetical protein